jgi:hypothetical protein
MSGSPRDRPAIVQVIAIGFGLEATRSGGSGRAIRGYPVAELGVAADERPLGGTIRSDPAAFGKVSHAMPCP